ncbi:tyrosine-type recombinase/integrase [Candidatus Woesearchaeota archaeon]|nr:tyrosine-type recombinase/integrase [Candidatus Woesearchaeota archaeon]
MKNELDIHSFSKRLSSIQDFARDGAVSKGSKTKKPISKKNAQLILKYDEARSFEGIKKATRMADIHRLIQTARILNKNFDKARKSEIKTMVASLETKYSAWTRAKMRMTFKRFYKWTKQGEDYLNIEEFPEEVRFIRRGLKKKDLPRIQRSECWNEDEMQTLLTSATHPRDKAIISVLTETGARVGEIGNLHIGDVYQDEFSYLLHLHGKTGDRDDRVLYSGPHLAHWLNSHPDRNNPTAPLFTLLSSQKPIKYAGLKAILIRLAKKAGLENKKCNPHIFRHSRATLLAEQGWPEPIIKEYLGWRKDSDMLATYSHIASRTANRWMLKAHGIGTEDNTKPKLKAQLCATCHAENGPDAKFCNRCARPLTHETILNYNHEKQKATDALNNLVDDPKYGPALRKLLSDFFNEKHKTQTETTNTQSQTRSA